MTIKQTIRQEQIQWLTGPFGRIVTSDPWHRDQIPTEDEERNLHGWSPSILSTANVYVKVTPEMLMDDALSQGYFAFRNALLKRACFL